MKSEPSIEELLQAVIEFIENRVIPKLEGHDKFHAHVAKNTLGIVLREIMLLRDYDEKEMARLKNILSKDDNIKDDSNNNNNQYPTRKDKRCACKLPRSGTLCA